MYIFLLVYRHLRLLQTGYLCILLQLTAEDTEDLQGTYITIVAENKENVQVQPIQSNQQGNSHL